MNLLLSVAIPFVLGAIMGALVMVKYRSSEVEKAFNESDGRWRVNMSNLLGFFLARGYEVEIDQDFFQVESPGDRVILSLPIRRFDPATLIEALGNLPRAGEWADEWGGESEEDDEPDEPPANDTST